MTFPVVDLVAVRRVVSTDALLQGSQKPARMIITGENIDSVPILVPYAPIRVEHGNLGGTYNYINRPGLADATVYGSPKVPSMTFDLLLIDKTAGPSGIQVSTPTVTAAVSIINTLKQYSEKGIRVRITYGSLESGLWYIDDITASSMKRDPVTDEIIQAGVSLSFIRASDIVEGLGPVTGGAATPEPSAPTPPQKTSARYHPVKAGDTLTAISIKYYGTAARWKEIGDANGIKNPRALPVGKLIRIP